MPGISGKQRVYKNRKETGPSPFPVLCHQIHCLHYTLTLLATQKIQRDFKVQLGQCAGFLFDCITIYILSSVQTWSTHPPLRHTDMFVFGYCLGMLLDYTNITHRNAFNGLFWHVLWLKLQGAGGDLNICNIFSCPVILGWKLLPGSLNSTNQKGI